MSTVLECIVDVCLPIAARWIIVQIGFFFGSNLNNSSVLWFITILLCSIVAECFTFQPKSKLNPKKEKDSKVLEEETAAFERNEAIQMEDFDNRNRELFPNEEHV